MIPEPAEGTFAVWFCQVYRRPWQVWHRDDTCTSEGERWHIAHQYGQGTGVEPKTWAELCEEQTHLDGPHLLATATRGEAHR